MSKRIALILMGIILMLGCSPKEQIQNDPWMDVQSENQYAESADTLTYDFLAETQPQASELAPAEPDLPVLQEEVTGLETPSAAAVEDTAPPIEPVPQAASRPPLEQGPLFWVQIFASANRQSAEECALKAEDKLSDRVRVLYLEPYYKVLVGGFSNRDLALELRSELVDMGYNGAWIFEK